MRSRCFILLVTCLPLFAQSLEQKLRETASRLPAQVFLYAKNLETGKDIGLNPDTPVRTASTIKLPIMAATFGEVAAGRASWKDVLTLTDENRVSGSGILREFSTGLNVPLKDCVHLMIVLSDNTATNMVLDRITADTVNNWMDELGFAGTRSMRKVRGDGKQLKPESGYSKAGLIESNKKYGLGVTTPREMVGLLEKLDRGEVINAEASNEMIAILRRQQYTDGIARGLGNTRVASKSGSLDALRSDVGIVYAKGGKIAIAITVDGITRPDWSPDNPGLLLISDLSRIIVEGLGGM